MKEKVSATDKDIKDILTLLTQGVESVFGSQLVGLYLTGSLSYGDFDAGSSDIDFMAVVKNNLTDEQRDRLAELHRVIGERYPNWATRIDGSYITEDIVDSIDPPKAPRPFINGGKFWHPDPPFKNDWLINIYNLRVSGVTLSGLDPKQVFPPVDIEKVKEASRKDLHTRWAATTEKTKPFERDGYDSNHLQAYAVLTMCRKLRFDKEELPASKKVAAAWAKQNFPQWSDLIATAEQWRHGQTLHIEEQARSFISFTLDELA